MMLMLNVFALADDDDWAALFTDNAWADAAGNSDSTSQSDLDDANAFWAAVTADQNQSSSTGEANGAEAGASDGLAFCDRFAI